MKSPQAGGGGLGPLQQNVDPLSITGPHASVVLHPCTLSTDSVATNHLICSFLLHLQSSPCHARVCTNREV